LQLKSFQQKLSSIKILDPACGSGNFLTESYLSLRKLENRVLENLLGDQTQLGFEGETNPIQVNINQFYGIEINDFAVSVAKTALWIAEEQMMDETQEILLQAFEFLPLKSNGNIVEGNALRINWDEILPVNECSYVIGNPPFKGAHAHPPRTKEQTEDLKFAFNNEQGIGEVDFVAAWFAKASIYISGCSVKCGFVATSSITQGQQPALIWKSLYERHIGVIFAYEPFLWSNEANESAAVAVTIIGFCDASVVSFVDSVMYKTDYITGDITKSTKAKNINPYLIDAPSVLVFSRNTPLCNVPQIGIGNKPIDGGHYLFKPEEYEEFITKEPMSKSYFRRWMGADEFIKGKVRYVLWLGDTDNQTIESMPLCNNRVRAVREYRLSSPSAGTRRLADTPTRFHVENMPKGDSILIPQTSSEKRIYLPLGFVNADTFTSNAVRLIPNATLFHFGVLSSLFHNAWMRVVTGRLESRYQYAGKVVYNNFPWPGVTKDTLGVPVENCVYDEVRTQIEVCAHAVLNARDAYEGKSLADLYDPETMPNDLKAAHEKLDAAVEAAYGVDFYGDEEKIVAYLFKKYAELT
jgi:hypothetical protein